MSFLDWTTVLLVPVYLVLVLTLARVSDQTWVTCPPCRSAAGLRTFSLIKMNVFINRSLPTRGLCSCSKPPPSASSSSYFFTLPAILQNHPGTRAPHREVRPSPHKPHQSRSFVLTLHQTTMVTPMIQKLLQILVVRFRLDQPAWSPH